MAKPSGKAKSGTPGAHARESATLAVGQLCASLRFKFEPYAIPMLPALVKDMANKDKKEVAVIGAAGFVVVWVCYVGVNLWGVGLHSYGWFANK